MSNSNYMDGVPVKIAEKYKPPPRIYQLPTAIATKLQLPEGHYQENPQYCYDFQLERKVLAKLPEYRRMRQTEREARQCRREKREQEKQRQIEEKHKEMLGAVNYPNAAELSSSESDDDDENSVKSKPLENVARVTLAKDMNWQHHNFDNILQPTVLSNEALSESRKDVAFAAFEKALANQHKTIGNTHSNSLTGSNVNSKLANTFNYKDFEEDTSSPFDNIELKTINDLDILAQVLHDTQLKANKDAKNTTNGEITIKDEQPAETKEVVVPTSLPPIETALDITPVNIDLTKVNFSDISLDLTTPTPPPAAAPQTDNIPTQHYLQNTFLPVSSTNTSFAPYSNSYQVYHNQNFLYSPNCNQLTAADNSNQMNQMPSYVAGNNNANNFCLTNDQLKQTESYHNKLKSPQILQAQHDEMQAAKSKSVPDIIRELRDEVRNSEMRRTRLRNHSFNQSDEHDESENQVIAKDTSLVTRQIAAKDESFANLAVSLQSLAKNISLMGFPLERVAKVAKIYGEDDKKIVEHLIPLTELLDLGFEETRISEALIKFDNNKEKALEHLIS